jgi:hypothetical protein
VVAEGVTFTEMAGAIPLKAMPPGFSVPLTAPVPVTKREIVDEPPAQTTADPPVMEAEGRALTVTVCDPVRSPATAEQLEVLSEAMV